MVPSYGRECVSGLRNHIKVHRSTAVHTSSLQSTAGIRGALHLPRPSRASRKLGLDQIYPFTTHLSIASCVQPAFNQVTPLEAVLGP